MPFIGGEAAANVGEFSAAVSGSFGYGGDDQMMVDTGPAHISFAAVIFALLALKVFTESDLVSDDPATIRVSALNLLQVGLMATVGIVSLKLLAAWLISRNINVPGFADLMGAV